MKGIAVFAVLVVVIAVVFMLGAFGMEVDKTIAQHNSTVAQQEAKKAEWEARQREYEARMAEANKELEYIRESHQTQRFELTLVALANNKGDFVMILGFVASLAFACFCLWKMFGRDRY